MSEYSFEGWCNNLIFGFFDIFNFEPAVYNSHEGENYKNYQ